MAHSFLERLGVGTDADERGIRRAYARELKQIDQEADPAGFQSLRESYESALLWLRYREREEEELETVDAEALQEEAEAGHAGQVTVAPVAEQGQAADEEADAVGAEPQPDGEQELALAVFLEFLQHGDEIRAQGLGADDAAWAQQLHRSLDDARLVGIVAREVFEWHVASLLAEGWRPGHEELLVAAGQVFGWNQDRRRVQALGQAGAMLDEAIAQRAVFDLQAHNEILIQRQLVARLRNPQPPGARELLRYTRALELMVARFPSWLQLVTSVPNIVQWRELRAEMPGWKRRIAGIGIPKRAEKTSQGSSVNWGWLAFLLIWGMIKLASNSHSGPSYTPASHERPAAARLVEQADQQLDEDKAEAAVATYNEAIAKDVGYSSAYSGRALAYIKQGNTAAAERDAREAERLNGSNPAAFRAQGMLALDDKRYVDALAAFTRAIQLDSDNAYTWYQRARTYEADKQPDRALEDAAEVIKRNPQYGIGPYVLRARVLQALNQKDKAAAEAEAMVKALPKSDSVYIQASDIYSALGRRDEALDVLERGVEALPKAAMLYVVHGVVRPASDAKGKRLDFDDAIRIDPHEAVAWWQRGELELASGHYEAAIADLSSALGESGGRPPTLVGAITTARGTAKSLLHRDAAAEQDFKAVRALRSDALALNNMCWELATHNVALKSALTSCEEALVKDPRDSATLDSKGFVLMRMGRYRDAIAAYDSALIGRPGQAGSLFGRGIAKLRVGDKAGGLADVEAARKANADIVSEYAGYGIKL